MKTTAAILAFTLAACSTVKTTVTAPDGTVTVTESSSTDPAALALAGTAITAYAPPRARTIREEKSGRISPAEIANRWKP